MPCYHVHVTPSPALLHGRHGVAFPAAGHPRAHCGFLPRRRRLMIDDGPRLAAAAVVVRAQKKQPFDFIPMRTNNFIEERRHIYRLSGAHARIMEGLLYSESRENSHLLCMDAGNAVSMASQIVDSADLNLGAPNEIARDTIRRTLYPYVEIFVQTADATYNRTVRTNTITSFLGALRGVASVSHIMLQAALEALGHDHPRESLSEYAFNNDVKIMHRVYNQRMYELEHDFENAHTSWRRRKIVMPTIIEGVDATESFVKLMLARRQTTLTKDSRKET